jgi:two-component system, response regulator
VATFAAGGAPCLGRAIEARPVFVHGGDHVVEFLGVQGFGEEGIGAEFIGAIDVLEGVGGGQDDNDQGAKGDFLAEPLEDFKAIFAGHLEVEEHEGGQRVFGAIGELAFAFEVSDGFLAITDNLNGILEAGTTKGAPKHRDIVVTVVREQNDGLGRIRGHNGTYCAELGVGREPKRRGLNGVKTPVAIGRGGRRIGRMPNVILLVDDDHEATEEMRKQFETFAGLYQLEVVHNARGAKDYLQGRGKYKNRGMYPLPTTVLLDLNMPGVDGFALLQWIRKQEDLKKVPVAVLTEATELRGVTRAYQMGAKTFLMKPAPIEELRDLLQALAA